MDLKEASAVAREHLGKLLAPDRLEGVRLEAFLYDDHLMVWSLTIGFAVTPQGEMAPAALPTRSYKIVRVSEANKSVLSVSDR